MRNIGWRERIVPTLMVAGVGSLLLSLIFGGFILYQWVLASEATATSLVLFAFAIRYYRRDPRKSKWPPLLPLAVICASGGAKSFYVATGKETPRLVILILLAAVVWFAVASWKIIRAGRRLTT
jgi:small neutral amino acid transporter SnatA (MarC family)